MVLRYITVASLPSVTFLCVHQHFIEPAGERLPRISYAHTLSSFRPFEEWGMVDSRGESCPLRQRQKCRFMQAPLPYSKVGPAMVCATIERTFDYGNYAGKYENLCKEQFSILVLWFRCRIFRQQRPIVKKKALLTRTTTKWTAAEYAVI